uniref:Uncharacterized protein n=1 Tax=Timema poppense TaxID=170557 RepID=A0A7R9HFW3_TIMPO|nr:unnamed protein product [Timema poppensis]
MIVVKNGTERKRLWDQWRRNIYKNISLKFQINTVLLRHGQTIVLDSKIKCSSLEEQCSITNSWSDAGLRSGDSKRKTEIGEDFPRWRGGENHAQYSMATGSFVENGSFFNDVM